MTSPRSGLLNRLPWPGSFFVYCLHHNQEGVRIDQALYVVLGMQMAGLAATQQEAWFPVDAYVAFRFSNADCFKYLVTIVQEIKRKVISLRSLLPFQTCRNWPLG